MAAVSVLPVLIEDVTALMPFVIADSVIGEVERAFVPDGLQGRNHIAEALCERAQGCFEHDAGFRRLLSADGNEGRDSLMGS